MHCTICGSPKPPRCQDDHLKTDCDCSVKQSDKEGEKLDPFAPEYSVPLPVQHADQYWHSHFGTATVWRRNERERSRVKCVNDAYDRLRNHLPLRDRSKRPSKVETLRLAIRYIRHLKKLLENARHENGYNCDFDSRSSTRSQ